MMGSLVVVVALGGALVLLLLWLAGTFNRFVSRRNAVDNAWGQVDCSSRCGTTWSPTWSRPSRDTRGTKRAS